MTKRAGTLLGLAWGDALGCPIETWSARQIAAVWNPYRSLPYHQPHQGRMRPLGLHSDDTQQALALINVVLGGWSPDRWGEWLLEGSRRKAWRGTGHNFRQAVRSLARGCAALESGSQSAGIGAAMRIAPLGALLSGDELMRVSMQSSQVTHADSRACTLAYAVAVAASELVSDIPIDQVRHAVVQRVRAVEVTPVVSDCLQACMRHVDAPPTYLQQRIIDCARPHLAADHGEARVNQGFALLGGVHGLLAALCTDARPHDILADIMQQGDDTDTVGAICGALLGARLGTEWIPMDRLLDAPRLLRYGAALDNPAGPVESIDEYMRAEAAWTATPA